jgi:predicted small integral membrane protein
LGETELIAVRLSKIALVAAAGLFCLLVGYNNIVDYGSNFMFVQHVLTMDTTFPDNAMRANRAILDPQLHRIAYWIIISAELLIGVVCLIGASRLLASLRATAERFNAAKSLLVAGLAGGMLFWFLGFIVVGGEWFQMWQSQIWNGQESAFRFIGSIGLILIFLSLDDG